ncbi:hypothetical protein BLA60_10090 [Actinophytocola xinjiangensis]|uniref:Uncharacterized protein n=1 Tax=Actinophytocola xinjiangensis TaxID=485602 RepID=A0A7Z0WQA5_9PSEU|nr:hypothetical protein [Actinophytocola xinjiangensis]OLF12313.1 hypothetical protein BLA60_10090 [Actinophytocola xinjiangensis]
MAVGACDLNVNAVGVQVPVEDVTNGANVSVVSPGSSDAIGATPENCASRSLTNGGTVQDY